MPEVSTEVALLKQKVRSHEETCGERYDRIASDTSEIKNTLTGIRLDFREGIERINQRIDAEVASMNAKIEKEKEERMEGQQKNKEAVIVQRNWILASVVAFLIGILAFFFPDYMASLKTDN